MKPDIVNATGAQFVKSLVDIAKFDDLRNSTSSTSAASGTAAAAGFNPTEATAESPAPIVYVRIIDTVFRCLVYKYSPGGPSKRAQVNVLFQQLPTDNVEHDYGVSFKYNVQIIDIDKDVHLRGYDLTCDYLEAFSGKAWIMRLSGPANSVRV